MITDWIYSNPTWLWGTILVVLVTSIASGGLLIFHRLVHVGLRRAHNDLAGFTIAIISVLYAVLLAFIAIATWESFTKASDIVENESDYVGGMYLDTAGLPDAKGQEIRNALEKYVSVVIDQEWPIQREGKTPAQGWKPLRDLATAIATIHPQNSGETVIEAELLKSWNEVYDARSARLTAVQGHVPGVIWCIVFFWCGDHDRLYLPLRIREFWDAHRHDGHGRRHSGARHSNDYCSRLAVPRPDQRVC
jgi:hypothetical protein